MRMQRAPHSSSSKHCPQDDSVLVPLCLPWALWALWQVIKDHRLHVTKSRILEVRGIPKVIATRKGTRTCRARELKVRSFSMSFNHKIHLGQLFKIGIPKPGSWSVWFSRSGSSLLPQVIFMIRHVWENIDYYTSSKDGVLRRFYYHLV